MHIGKTFYTADRKIWRAWLKKHAEREKEVWLIYYKKNSGKFRIPYDDAVEEALCFGWIDSILKPIDEEKYAQRFSPRRKGSSLSELNKERVRRLLRQKKMTSAGLAALDHEISGIKKRASRSIAKDILCFLKADKEIWRHYSRFPIAYKTIRLGWIEGARKRPEIFHQRLQYFLKMTKQNKRFGSIQK
jgi:uncharacterized protein YdeI (YjbR/CyaY-like superfamily)